MRDAREGAAAHTPRLSSEQPEEELRSAHTESARGGGRKEGAEGAAVGGEQPATVISGISGNLG